MIILGLTGSIGAGKSFVAEIFREQGVPVFDADATVHAMLEPGGEGVVPVAELFPEAFVEGRINRKLLGQKVFFDEASLKALEAILHPLVKQAGERFLAQAMAEGRTAMVQDIPLLFETGADKDCHATVVVTVPEHVQESRVLQREGMTKEQLAAIRMLQMQDAAKASKATFVIDGTLPKEEIKVQVRGILEKLSARKT